MATARCLRPQYDGASAPGLAEGASAVKLRVESLCLLERFSGIDEHLLQTASYVLMNDDF